MQMTKQKKLYAIKLAYRIVTDKRNVSRYMDTFLTNDAGASITYPEMIDGLETIYKEIDSPIPEKLGHWYQIDRVRECSVCGGDVLGWNREAKCTYKFCPWCGVEMDVEGDQHDSC